MTDWFVGQKAECIHDGGWEDISPNGRCDVGCNPRYLEVLTVSRIAPWPFDLDPHSPPFTVGLTFLEYSADDFASYCFRPLVETKTDISVFERVLGPGMPKVKEFA
jgi:hypothetical protein